MIHPTTIKIRGACMDRRKVDVIFFTILIILSLIIITNDSFVEGGAESELGAMFLPRVVAGLILIFSVIIGGQSLYSLLKSNVQNQNERLSVNGFSGVVIYIGIFISYWFLSPLVGFLIITPFVMFSIALLLGGRNWIPIILMSLITPALVYYGANHFLRVFLPTWNLT
jgi:hypothetical protein